jgi:hypothetical protein
MAYAEQDNTYGQRIQRRCVVLYPRAEKICRCVCSVACCASLLGVVLTLLLFATSPQEHVWIVSSTFNVDKLPDVSSSSSSAPKYTGFVSGRVISRYHVSYYNGDADDDDDVTKESSSDYWLSNNHVTVGDSRVHFRPQRPRDRLSVGPVSSFFSSFRSSILRTKRRRQLLCHVLDFYVVGRICDVLADSCRAYFDTHRHIVSRVVGLREKQNLRIRL